MIRSYSDTRTERFAGGERVPQFESFRRQAEKRLRLLEAATSLRDLAQIPGNRLEALRRRPERSIQHPDQPAMAHLFRVAATLGCSRER